MLDRRKPNDKDNADKNILESDELIIFEPPNDSNTFPKEQAQPMFYFDMSRRCVIPNIGYNNGQSADAYVDTDDHKEKLEQQPITSQSNCNGAMIMLSFHVESTDEIRCYFYTNGQFLRFMPSDIINLFPSFFDKEVGDNKTFAESDLAKKLVEDMNQNLRDVNFEAFLKKYQSKQSQDDEN